jgi:Tfp pilus assembly protein PilF
VLLKSPVSDTSARAWALTTLAEIAVRLGKTAAAETYFQEALRLNPEDTYLSGAYADFLLDDERPAAARDLLRDRTGVDALLLRLALAEARLSEPDAAQHIAILQARFAAARLRGDSAHGREEARLALHLLHQTDAALQLASANWEAQREPADARIVLEAAYASGNAAAARPVLEFLSRNRTEDIVLQRLANAIEATPR